MTETAQTITDWAYQTFGIPVDVYRVIGRANEECLEALRETYVDPLDLKKVALECADTAIVLIRAMHLIDPAEARFDSPTQKLEAVLKDIRSMISWSSTNMSQAMNPTCKKSLIVPRLLRSMWQIGWACKACGHDLQDVVDEKMAINRNRTWDMTGAGTSYHKA